MAWIESPYRKKRTRYYNNKKAELERLNAKWTNEFRKLGVGNALDRASTAYQGERTNGMLLSYYEIHNPAWNYAENKAASSLTFIEAMFSGSGVIASISRDGIDKILSPKAVNKTLKNGHKKELHFAIAEKVGDLFKKAEFSHSEAPRNQSQDIVAYHKYNAHFKINGKDAKAKITLKESFEAGHKIYSLELLEIE